MALLSSMSSCHTPIITLSVKVSLSLSLSVKKQLSNCDDLQQDHVKMEGKTDPQQLKQLELSKCLVPPLLAAIVTLSPFCNPQASLGQAVEAHRGAALFNRACIGCHVGGGNIIQPGTTLFSEDLARNGVGTEEEIYKITYSGKGRMPGFGQNCTPRGQCTFGPRLQDEEIKLLAEFVRSEADQGWPSNASQGD